MTGPDGTNIGYDAPRPGARSLLLSVYEWPRYNYVAGVRHPNAPADLDFEAVAKVNSAAYRMRELGCLIAAAHQIGRMARKVKPVNVPEMIEKWHRAIVGLAVAHDKDEADKYEASIEECLSPILTAPIKQIREFAPKLLAILKADKAVPFLVWRSYEVWLQEIFDKAPDEGVKELKTALAREISELVEQDVKTQLPEAIIRALQWRSPEALSEVKKVIEQEKAEGRPVRLKGRESCLFLEAGGTDEKPAVCIQI